MYIWEWLTKSVSWIRIHSSPQAVIRIHTTALVLDIFLFVDAALLVEEFFNKCCTQECQGKMEQKPPILRSWQIRVLNINVETANMLKRSRCIMTSAPTTMLWSLWELIISGMKGQGILFCNCICSWQPVRVVHGDGHVRSLNRPITVGELLKRHPHHFVCKPTADGPLYHSGMLPLDMELEEGNIYLLLPLPRLLPHLASTFPDPLPCPCFSNREAMYLSSNPAHMHEGNHAELKTLSEEHSIGRNWSIVKSHGQFLVIATKVRNLRHRVAISKPIRSLIRMSQRILPERLLLRSSFHKLKNEHSKSSSSSSVVGKSVQYCTRNRWRPGLECISEVGSVTGLLRDWDQWLMTNLVVGGNCWNNKVCDRRIIKLTIQGVFTTGTFIPTTIIAVAKTICDQQLILNYLNSSFFANLVNAVKW